MSIWVGMISTRSLQGEHTAPPPLGVGDQAQLVTGGCQGRERPRTGPAEGDGTAAAQRL